MVVETKIINGKTYKLHKMPDGGHCWLEPSDLCYGCAYWGCGMTHLCAERAKTLNNEK